jgi:flagellar basal body-associated protein FliL
MVSQKHISLDKYYFIIFQKEESNMALLWVTLLGLVIILLISGGTIVYFLRQALDSEDATRIDKITPNDSNQS